MDENTKDVVVVVATRTVTELKNRLVSITETGAFVGAFALFGLYCASWLAIVLCMVFNIAVVAYCEYKSFIDEIEFDKLQAEQDSKDALREEREMAESTEKPKTFASHYQPVIHKDSSGKL